MEWLGIELAEKQLRGCFWQMKKQYLCGLFLALWVLLWLFGGICLIGMKKLLTSTYSTYKGNATTTDVSATIVKTGNVPLLWNGNNGMVSAEMPNVLKGGGEGRCFW